jgi:FtsH-binding integral membrane protein
LSASFADPIIRETPKKREEKDPHMSQFPQSESRRWELEYGTDNKVVFNFFNAVYAWMAVGLAVTAVVAYFTSQSQAAIQAVYGTPLKWVLFLGMFAIAMGVGAAAMRISAAAATALFLLYASLMGVLLSGVVLFYDPKTIVTALALTGGVFGGMSVYGFVTKRDLTRIGSILVMCVWGLILASVVNIFIASSALDWIICYAVLAVFIGLTAFETQKLRNIAEQVGTNSDLAARYAIVGSLMLYIAFINIFLSILQILGNRR